MLTKNDFIKSFFQFSLGQWIGALISFIAIPITTWLIVPEEFGKASMFTLAFNLLLNFSLLGADQSFVRLFYERDEDDRRNLLWESLLPSLTIGLMVFVLMLILWEKVSFIIFGDYEQYLSVLLLGVAIIVGIFEHFALLVVRMEKRGIVYSIIRIINAFTNVIITIIYALFISKTFNAMIAGILFSSLISAVFAIIFEKQLWCKKFKINIRSIRYIIGYGLPFVPAFFTTWVFQSIDRLALRSYSDFTEIGLYSAAFKVVAIMSLIQAGFTTFWTPVAYESYENEPENTIIFEKTSVFIAAIMFTLGTLIVVFNDIIFLLLATSYRNAARIVPFLLLVPIMYTVSEVTFVGINFKKKTYWHILIASVAAIANFIGNMWLVPIYGAKGAALSTGLSYIIFFSMRTFISIRLYSVKYYLKKFYFCALIFIIVAFSSTFVYDGIMQLFISILGCITIIYIYNDQIHQIIVMIKEYI